jgi:hypothetical protein
MSIWLIIVGCLPSPAFGQRDAQIKPYGLMSVEETTKRFTESLSVFRAAVREGEVGLMESRNKPAGFLRLQVPYHIFESKLNEIGLRNLGAYVDKVEVALFAQVSDERVDRATFLLRCKDDTERLLDLLEKHKSTLFIHPQVISDPTKRWVFRLYTYQDSPLMIDWIVDQGYIPLAKQPSAQIVTDDLLPLVPRGLYMYGVKMPEVSGGYKTGQGLLNLVNGEGKNITCRLADDRLICRGD